MDLKRPADAMPFYKDENKWLIAGDEVNDAQKQIDFINNSLATDVQLSLTLFDIITKNLFWIIILILFYKLIENIYNILLK